MIVLDVSVLVSAAFRPGSVPDQAVRHAVLTDQVAVSELMMAELLDVLYRPRIARFIDPGQRAELLDLLDTLGIVVVPTTPVADCRDPKDDKYLELALASGAGTLVTGDADLLVLHPWRGVRILRPAEYLAEVEGRG